MNSLEFIENQIDATKKQLAKYPLTEKQSNPNYKYKDSDLQCIFNKRYTEQLQILQRIKNVLELWEILTVELDIKVIERHRGMFGSIYALECTYEDVIPILDEEAEAFKKALEVEEDD